MITDIRLQNFRSYSDETFEFSPSVNIIVGPNASGKTNLLEALLVIARGGSYRVKDLELIAFTKPWARVETRSNDNDRRVVTVERQQERAHKLFKLNDQPLQRLGIQRTIPLVLFEPNHLQLLTGAPERRRNFLDDILEQIQPGFTTLRQQYRRVLSQRNALLKSGRQLPADQLFVWNVRLSEFGGQIVQARSRIVNEMNERIGELYRDIANASSNVTLAYESLANPERYATDLLQKLEASHQTDQARGFTLYGPHREDLLISLNGHAAQETASRGETRTLLLSLKVIEAILIEQARKIRPLLLFDDVFSELDGRRRQALTQFLQSYQTFITTTDADVVIRHFTEQAKIIPLSARK
jgi:DNA replication and repair protein RecF